MGLLDILASLPKAITEKARVDEFGQDYRQRWQRAQDVHTRSEVENAISNTNRQITTTNEAARLKAAMKEAGLQDPEEALASISVSDRERKKRAEEAGIGHTEALTGYLKEKPDIAYAGIDARAEAARQLDETRRQLGEARSATDRERLDLQYQRLRDIQDRFETTRGDIGPTVTVVDPRNPNGPGMLIDRRTRQPVQLDGGGTATKPATAAERKDKSGLEVIKEQLGDLKAIVAKPNVSGRIGYYSGKMESARNSGVLSPLQSVGMVDKPDPDYVSAQTRLTDIADQLLRARSGAQINEKEYDRLRGLVPDLTSGDLTVFNTKMQRFEEDLDRTLASRFGSGSANIPADALSGAANAPDATKSRFRIINVQ